MSKSKTGQQWQESIPSCFGTEDCKFAIHPSDESRARQAIKDAKAEGATRNDFEKELLWHVYTNVGSREVFWELVEEQKTKLKKMWK